MENNNNCNRYIIKENGYSSIRETDDYRRTRRNKIK